MNPILALPIFAAELLLMSCAGNATVTETKPPPRSGIEVISSDG